MAQGKQQRESREALNRLKRYEARRELHATRNRRRVRDNIVAVVGLVVVAGLAGFAQAAYFSWGPGAPAPEPTTNISTS